MSSKNFGCQLPGALHAGLKAAPNKSQNPGPKRQQALLDRSVFWKQIQREKKLEALMEKYDVSKTGNLTREELGHLLQDAAKGRMPTEEEINYVLWTVHPKTGENKNRGDRITKNEIATALDVWRVWEQTLPEMEPLMAKYDVNHSGKLEFDQLKNLLTDLNEGRQILDAEVEWVMKGADGKVDGVDKTGGVNITELKGAIALWMTHLEESEPKSCRVC